MQMPVPYAEPPYQRNLNPPIVAGEKDVMLSTSTNAGSWRRSFVVSCAVVVGLLTGAGESGGPIKSALTAAETKKIVLIAGKKSHGPEGNGIHDYPWSAKLLKVMLDNSNVRDQLRVEYHRDGWPADESTLLDADTIVIISDGRDGDLYEEAPHLASDERVAFVKKLVERGCGLVTFHFSTFTPDKYATEIFDWTGGYFDWEQDGKKQWYSAIQHLEADVELASGSHPVARGVKPFRFKEEFYFNIRFHPQPGAVQPLLRVPALPGREPDGSIVAWARQRPNGGRGFGTTCGHFYENWTQPEVRRMMLNAVVWTAGIDPPPQGIEARFYSHQEITAALRDAPGTVRAVFDERPIRALMFAGNEAHKWHNWEKTAPALQALLERDPRIKVDITFDIEDLAVRNLNDYQLIVQNYCNWHDKRPLSEASRTAFSRYLREGGGLILIHFANGAFHPSLPEAGESDWPEYRKIVRRVWNHHGKGEKQSGHDAFGEFTVRVEPRPHPVTEGLSDFQVTDELYFRQDGDEPIEPLITAQSKVTMRDEPLAWTYSYGEGRVFQTVLGHSEKTYESFEACEMIRRAAAWVARRPIVAGSKPADPANDTKKSADNRPASNRKPAEVLAEGRFGQALDARGGGVIAAGNLEYRKPPFSVECWTRLRQKANYNILVAHEPKSSATHWELFTMAGSGVFTVYLPGMTPDHVSSNTDITDDKWHHVAMMFEPDRIRLYVDGRKVADQAVKSGQGAPVDGGLAIGELVGREIGCQGFVDEVRIARGVREFTRVPHLPYPFDDETIGIWHLDIVDKGKSPDDSPTKNHAAISWSPVTANSFVKDHWGVEVVGFAWTENDSRDGRWQKTDIGRFLASTVPLEEGPVRKGLSIRLGDRSDATILYDTQFGRVRAAWTGEFLQFDPARFGLIVAPKIAGTRQFSQAEGPGWPGAKYQYLGMHRHADRVILRHQVDDTRVEESPWCYFHDERPIFERTLVAAARVQPITMRVADLKSVTDAKIDSAGPRSLSVTRNGVTTTWQITADAAARLQLQRTGDQAAIDLQLAPATEPTGCCLRWWNDAAAPPPQHAFGARSDEIVRQFAALRAPGPPSWTDRIVTQGVVAPDNEPYVIDTLTLPFDNPYRALFFLGGMDFFPNGDLAVATVHGDVWRVHGVDRTLRELSWKRFATGLFQPLGLKIVDGQVHVLGRDQITRLIDLDGDGEADEYQNFFNGAHTSEGGHDYVAGLETDQAGNFYFLHATQGLLKVNRDGTELSVVATGLRNPVGLSVGPDDTITAAPQEGEWTPASNLIQVKPGGHYGYLGPRVTLSRPLGYDPPLCWIPRMTDNSSGGQVWVTSDRWGPLQGQLLHLSFGKCRLLLALRESIAGSEQGGKHNGEHASVQGGVIDFPWQFDSGLMRGRFSPHDGQLYLAGLKGWVTSAVQDGCLQRVRYTGLPVDLPEAVRTYPNGLAIRFTSPLNADSAEDPDAYRLEGWNYRYSKDYGSPDLKLSDPLAEGHDEWNVRSATLLQDGRTLFLELPGLRPMNQLRIEYELTSSSGREFQGTLNYTIHQTGNVPFPESQIRRRQRQGLLDPEVEERLRPGVAVRFEQETPRPEQREERAVRSDMRVDRLFALRVEASEPVSLHLQPGPFRSSHRAYLRSPRRMECRFAIECTGMVVVRVNGEPVLSHRSNEPGVTESQPTALRKGVNLLELDFQSSPNSASGSTSVPVGFRLLWEGPGFAREAVPSALLFHDPRQPELDRFLTDRAGQSLWLSHRCQACHDGIRDGERKNATAGWEVASQGGSLDDLFVPPDLIDVARRLEPAWIARWIDAPAEIRPGSRMPRFEPSASRSRRQESADITMFLASLSEPGTMPPGERERSNGAADSDGGMAERGALLFEELSCVACHYLQDGERDAHDRPHDRTHERLSLSGVGAKYRSGALRDYLRNPAAHASASRMPVFTLDDDQLDALEAWLLRANPAEQSEWPELAHADIDQGRSLYSRQCFPCHQNPTAKRGPGTEPREVAPRHRSPLRLDRLTHGCLADDLRPASQAPERRAPNQVAPQYTFNDSQRTAIRRFLTDAAAAGISLTGPAAPNIPMEESRLLVHWLQCAACHPRDGQSSVRIPVLLEESLGGGVPEFVPNLTFAGEKLRGDWLHDQIAGLPTTISRPWLKGRMPSFGPFAARLAHGLVREHGLAAGAVPMSEPDRELVEIGDRLTTPAGLDCRQCHAVGAQQPRGDQGTQIALGINFAQVRRRLQPEFYARFVRDPPRFEASSKMPKLSDDGKTTKAKSILDGDADRQFAAIWQFILSLP
jgi:type 1 glutamine amidotransferase/cytochrome c2